LSAYSTAPCVADMSLKTKRRSSAHCSIVKPWWRFDASYNRRAVAAGSGRAQRRGREGRRNAALGTHTVLRPRAYRRSIPTINARVETVETAASLSGTVEARTALIQVAAGFYEWHLSADGKKQPFFIHLADREVFGFAGLWDKSFAADGVPSKAVFISRCPPMTSCAIFTTPEVTLTACPRSFGRRTMKRGSAVRPTRRVQLSCNILLISWLRTQSARVSTHRRITMHRCSILLPRPALAKPRRAH